MFPHEIILLNKQNVGDYCQMKRKKEKSWKSWWRKGSKSSHTCSAQQWVLLPGDWETSLDERSPGGLWHSREPRGPASWWSGTAESLGSHGSLSEETTQPLFFFRQTAVSIFWSLLLSLTQRAEQAFSSHYTRERVLRRFSLWEILSWTPSTNEVGNIQLRTMKVNASSQFKLVDLESKPSWLGTLQGDFSPHIPWLHLSSLLWCYCHKPPRSHS